MQTMYEFTQEQFEYFRSGELEKVMYIIKFDLMWKHFSHDEYFVTVLQAVFKLAEIASQLEDRRSASFLRTSIVSALQALYGTDLGDLYKELKPICDNIYVIRQNNLKESGKNE